MPLEPHRILPVVKVLAAVRTNDNLNTLAALAATNSELRQLCLPFLFAQVRWPHPGKHDEESGLHFFPENLWPHFKRFDLIWPDDWPDASPPRWGDRYYDGGDYHPRHTDKLATALPRMPSLLSFSICCPFFPPNSLFNALLTCTSVRELRMTDTPLYISMIPKSPPEFVIERLYLIPVAEAPRVGQSPYEARYSSPTLYHSREYRKKYKNDILARYAAFAFLFDVAKPTSLTHVQVSGDLCTLDEFAQHDWPRLASLVMTGHPPRQTGTELVDVVSKMKDLKELRLLFAKSVARGDAQFKVLPAAPEYISAKGNRASLLEQIESLAVSDACNLDRVGYFVKGVERLAILAISDIAEPTVAFTRHTLQKILREVSAAGRPAPRTIPPKQQHKSEKNPQPDTNSEFVTTQMEVHKNRVLKHLRVMLGETIEPDFCKFLADRFPKVEVLEVERCAYHDGRNVSPWSDYVDNLKPIRRTLQILRLGMPFEASESVNRRVSSKSSALAPINDDADPPPPLPSSSSKPAWHFEREKCAHYFAKRLGQLTRVGFEYRNWPGPHRIDDRWLDWDIERRRFTPERQRAWDVRREAKLERVAEERKAEAEEEERRMDEKGTYEKLRMIREREAKERQWLLKSEAENEVVEGGGDECQITQATVTRQTSTRHTATSTSTPTTSIATTPPAGTPSLTTPLSHPSSNKNLSAQNSTNYTVRQPPQGHTNYQSSFNQQHRPSGSFDPGISPPTTPTYSSPVNAHRSSTSITGLMSPKIPVDSTTSPRVSTTSRQQTNASQDYFMSHRFVADPRGVSPEPEAIEEVWDSDDEDPEGILGIYELRPSWYPFPECWKGRTLWEEEEVADAGDAGGEEYLTSVGHGVADAITVSAGATGAGATDAANVAAGTAAAA